MFNFLGFYIYWFVCYLFENILYKRLQPQPAQNGLLNLYFDSSRESTASTLLAGLPSAVDYGRSVSSELTIASKLLGPELLGPELQVLLVGRTFFADPKVVAASDVFPISTILLSEALL